MTEISVLRGAKLGLADGAAALSSVVLPLVSVIVTNFNYGRFLLDAVKSVQEQSYSEIECVVVDDCSTDNSCEVLSDIERRWPDVTIRRLAVNSGQSVAALEGYKLTKGDFVLFLDADDILFPKAVLHHLAVHMASRHAVGFTCCDAMQVVDDRIITARNTNISRTFLSRPAVEGWVSVEPNIAFQEWGIELPEISSEQLRHIYYTEIGWPWSTTSSMLFRRDVLEMIMQAAGLPTMRIATDNFLAKFANHLAGSMVFDAQLVAYRLHGKNGFNRRASLDGFYPHDRMSECHSKVYRIIIKDVFERLESFSANMDDPERALEICYLMDVNDIETEGASLSFFARVLRENQGRVADLYGHSVLAKWNAKATAPHHLHQDPSEKAISSKKLLGRGWRRGKLSRWLWKSGTAG